MKLTRDTFFYYDYAGGTYYSVKLCWFFNCPEDLEELVWTDGERLNWHIHDGNDANHICYHAQVPITEELRDYFRQQRYWFDKYKKCQSKNERFAVNEKFKQRA